MFRRRLIVALCALLGLGISSARAEERPHLLVLAIDTLRADRLGCYGHESPTSPHIDALAAQGLRLERALSPAPWTLPSFATILTGRYPTRHGAGAAGPLRNLAETAPQALSPEVPTLAEWLRDAGYRTAGITANPYLRLGLERGFDEWVCKTVSSERIGALTRSWLARQDPDEPWFLFVHFNDPHEPTDTADPWLRALGHGEEILEDPERGALERWGSRETGSYLGRQENAEAAAPYLETKLALYDGAILQVDAEVGLILQALRRRGMERDTLVVLLSDHGEEFLEHGPEERAWAADPRGIWGIGHGHTLFDEQLHVPLILRGPQIPAGATVAQQFPLTELMPTLLGWLGVSPPPGMDGIDRRAWLSDEGRSPIPMGAEGIGYGPDLMAWLDGRYALITDRLGQRLWSYDLRQDPDQRRPLGEGVVAVDSLAARLARWSDRMAQDAPAPTGTAEITDAMREGLKALGYVQ